MAQTNPFLTDLIAADDPISRRQVLRRTGIGLATAAGLGSGVLRAQTAPDEASRKKYGPDKAVHRDDFSKPIELKPLNHPTEQKDAPLPAVQPPDRRIGYALVGLGTLTLAELLPALQGCTHSKCTALVSGSREKALKVAAQYSVPERSVYSYENYDDIRNNPDVDAVFIVLPNSMHEEYTVRAARAGKHVLCEKPMANTAAEAQRMIDACKEAKKKLMIAYRIQYEPHHRQVQEWLRKKEYGAVKMLDMVNVQNVGDPEQWRLKKALAGGGALPDIGLYCLNTARFLTGEEPVRVQAMQYSTPGDKRFAEVEESVWFTLQFPGGVVAQCTTSYGVHDSRRYRCYTDAGAWYGLDPAFSYHGLKAELAQAKGTDLWRSNWSKGDKNQFALEMDHFSRCILEDKTPYTPGEEGLQDHVVMEAIYRSAREGKVVELPVIKKLDAFRGWRGETG